MKDLRCLEHDTALVFMPEDSEYRCTEEQDADNPCKRLTLVDIVTMMNGQVAWI